MKFKLKPYPHQMYAIDMAKRLGNVGLLWEMGAGKTGGLINILRDLYATDGRLKRTLILSPAVTLYNWKEEFGIHSYVPKEYIHVLSKGGSKGKIREFVKYAMNPTTKAMDGHHIFITNYESMNSEELFKLLMEWNPEIMVLDEAHYIKNPQAKRSKAIIKLGDKVKHKYILTGTPILNSIQDVYNLFRFLDGGETFGKNFHVFRHTYMEDENQGWSGKKGHFPKFVARSEMYGHMTDLIYTKCHRVLKADVIKDQPPLIKTTRLIEMSPEQKKHYKLMERDFITFVESKEKSGESAAVVAQLAVTKALRLQQIASGFLQTEEGEVIEITKNPRLDVTKELLQELVVDGKNKVILWCSFKHNYKQLSRICTELGIKHGFITGEQKLEDKQKAMDEFNKGDDSVVIANRRAGGIGINLVAAAYSIVYSRNFSLGEELQSEARNHRGGSQIHEQIVKIDLASKDTVDELVLEALINKNDVSKQVIDLVRRKK